MYNRYLIEQAFCLRQASIDGTHEKLCHAGHVKAFHIWPARRPLAACRAALIATLLPDPGTADLRRDLCEKIGGKVVKKIERKTMPEGQAVERIKEETEGGVLRWGREIENAVTLDWFRKEIKKAYGGRAPRVLDPFAGGGAIPLEAMRLGCEATAIDINPVAWFILKCSLEYPQKFAMLKRPLPPFILKNRAFMEEFYSAQGRSRAEIRKQLEMLGHRADTQQNLSGLELGKMDIAADLSWHVRAWGHLVLESARSKLARFYPVYATFEPLDKDKKSYETEPMRLVPLQADGTPDINSLNSDFGAEYLEVKSNPRWVSRPTVAYLWARTVACKNCRASIPLIKTRWLSKKDRKRVLLTMEPTPEQNAVIFGVDANVPIKGGNAAQRREHDKRIGAGTMSRAGAKCPCCDVIMTMSDLRVEGLQGRIAQVMTAVVRRGRDGKEFAKPTRSDLDAYNAAAEHVESIFKQVPFGLPNEPLANKDALGFRAPLYGFIRWEQLFTRRQLAALGTLVSEVRNCTSAVDSQSDQTEWNEAIRAYLACVIDKVADYNSSFVAWQPKGVKGANTFQRWALPMKWDFTENNILDSDSGGWRAVLEWVTTPLKTLLEHVGPHATKPTLLRQSALKAKARADVVVTDPPYYDAIPYSDLMDFFYVWLRRIMWDASPEHRVAFESPLGPKWDHDANDGELIDDASRHGGDARKSKNAYENGMFTVFQACERALEDDGRLVVAFAHKDPDAWETLASAIIRAGFFVDGSWPIQTEMVNRTRAQSSSSLASSVWLVCKKRPALARPGWDNKVLEDMRTNIGQRLREFWDSGIRGPDFVWAATGPALEAYSVHPVVKMADDPGKTLTVTEFLNHARRMVVDFVVGRVLGGADEAVGEAAIDRLDELTAYYLLHRNDFGLDDAPVGACILYATACGLSDNELTRDWDLLTKTGGDESSDDEGEGDDSEIDEDPGEETGSGSKVKLKPWNHRRGRSMGIEAPGGRPVPLIDRIHRLMHLWKGGDVHKVDEYLDEHALRRHELFRRVLQSLIELSKQGSEERSLLESLSNHIGAKGAKKKDPQRALAYDDNE